MAYYSQLYSRREGSNASGEVESSPQIQCRRGDERACSTYSRGADSRDVVQASGRGGSWRRQQRFGERWCWEEAAAVWGEVAAGLWRRQQRFGEGFAAERYIWEADSSAGSKKLVAD
ncbi:hypothetical protein E2562_034702 [Oryza meyeriana var. granulata]|uniref:Uncharacterized protein n=1 Tax=Oryza meyeriana var. granulata TaxID=110450 RepID=A0A6G1CC71_9ORYZ|nr:hypothetical protein E2562_034702 [Oryza meyeriana var. granulata]